MNKTGVWEAPEIESQMTIIANPHRTDTLVDDLTTLWEVSVRAELDEQGNPFPILKMKVSCEKYKTTKK